MSRSVRAIYQIPADEECPAHARAIVDREIGARVPRPMLEELELLVSELVTGAVPAPADGESGSEAIDPDPILLDLRIDGRIRCAVVAPGAPPAGDGAGLRGWSLRMVAGLAARWGLTRTAGIATRVWFETDPPG